MLSNLPEGAFVLKDNEARRQNRQHLRIILKKKTIQQELPHGSLWS